MKIAGKILEVIRQIPNEQELTRLNEVLASQKLIPKAKYQIENSRERTTVQGVVWQLVTVSCELTIIDTESDEEITYIALGSGTDHKDKAVSMAQMMARRYAWLVVLNIMDENLPEVEGVPFPEVLPEIIVETPESKLITHITALWKARWDPALLPGWIEQRFKKPIEQLNITELSVVKSELENYGR